MAEYIRVETNKRYRKKLMKKPEKEERKINIFLPVVLSILLACIPVCARATFGNVRKNRIYIYRYSNSRVQLFFLCTFVTRRRGRCLLSLISQLLNDMQHGCVAFACFLCCRCCCLCSFTFTTLFVSMCPIILSKLKVEAETGYWI